MDKLCLEDFKVVPSVVEVGKETEIRIIPKGDNFKFFDDCEYELHMWPAEYSTFDIDKMGHTVLKLKPDNGILKYKFYFDYEQHYKLNLIIPENQRYCDNKYYNLPSHGKVPRAPELQWPVMYMYALNSDLYNLRPFKGDFHLHSSESDGHESSAAVIANLRKAGFDFAGITNHYWYHGFKSAKKAYEGFSDVFTIIPGEEVHIPHELVHIVAIGHKQSLDDYYTENKEMCDAQINELEANLDVPSNVNGHNYASRLWVADKIKEFGGMPVLTHPYWLWNDIYFIPTELTKLLYESGRYEVFEMLNGGCGYQSTTLNNAFLMEERSKGFNMPMIGSSDAHVTDRDDERCPTDSFSIVLCENREWDTIHNAILNYQSVAVEKYHGEKSWHIYGDLRMVKYVSFLLNNYYPQYQRYCYAQGLLMREYAMDKDKNKSKITEELSGVIEEFKKEFFGK